MYGPIFPIKELIRVVSRQEAAALLRSPAPAAPAGGGASRRLLLRLLRGEEAQQAQQGQQVPKPLPQQGQQGQLEGGPQQTLEGPWRFRVLDVGFSLQMVSTGQAWRFAAGARRTQHSSAQQHSSLRPAVNLKT